MKLENLLAPYLYQYKRLDLPGIGIFEAEASTVAPEETDKHQAAVQGITFRQHPVLQPDDELIDFIKTHTGKMKPLAMADLESYLMLVKQFVNIGKPFYIEGIGTLQKITNGTLRFTPGAYLATRVENNGQEFPATSKQKEYSGESSSSRESGTGKSGAGKAVIAVIVIATIAAIGWGGYYLYKMNTQKQQTTLENIAAALPDSSYAAGIKTDSTPPAGDTSATIAKADTAVTVTATMNPGDYKFVFETTDSKSRAIYRYNYLSKINPKIQLQTPPDSSLFKIYVVLPATAADTARVKDSLNAWYYGKKERRVSIEK